METFDVAIVGLLAFVGVIAGISGMASMQISDFELFATKAEEERTEREYVEAVRDYWIIRTQLEEAVGGNLNPHVRSER